MRLQNLNSPDLMAVAGASIVINLPMLDIFLSSLESFNLLKSPNIASFAANVVAVLVLGQLEGHQDDKLCDKTSISKKCTTLQQVRTR